MSDDCEGCRAIFAENKRGYHTCPTCGALIVHAPVYEREPPNLKPPDPQEKLDIPPDL